MNYDYKQLNRIIREMDIEIENLNIDISNSGNIIFLANHMLKMQKIILLTMICFGALFGGILKISNFLVGILYGGLLGLGLSLFSALISWIFYSSVSSFCKKKIEESKNEMDACLELKKYCEEELSKIKQQEMDVEDSNRNVFSFDRKDNFVVESILDNQTEEKSKFKKLSLRKKK